MGLLTDLNIYSHLNGIEQTSTRLQARQPWFQFLVFRNSQKITSHDKRAARMNDMSLD